MSIYIKNGHGLSVANFTCTSAIKGQVLSIIIQQIVTLSKYGHDARDICHP